jgi:hypothetical protein
MVIGLLVALGMLIGTSPDPDPVYEGKPLSYWFKRYVENTATLTNRIDFDSRAIPYLVTQMFSSTPLVEKIYINSPPMAQALMKRAHLSPKAPSVWRRRFAGAELVHLAPRMNVKQLNAVAKGLDDKDTEKRFLAAGVISQGYVVAPDGVTLLERCLGHPDSFVRYEALSYLGRMPTNATVLNLITNNFNSQDPACRDAAKILLDRWSGN